MDRRIQQAALLDIMWTAKHGKQQDYIRLRKRFTSWMYDDADD